MYKVTAWEVESDKFSGLVYSQKIVLDKMEAAEWYTVKKVFLYREHKPMNHVKYEEI